jgi:hypothetical protein
MRAKSQQSSFSDFLGNGQCFLSVCLGKLGYTRGFYVFITFDRNRSGIAGGII